MPARSRLTKKIVLKPTVPTLGEKKAADETMIHPRIAKSRLKNRPKSTSISSWISSASTLAPKNFASPIPTVFAQSRHPEFSFSKSLKKYLQQFHLVVMSMGGYAATAYIFLKIHPEQISHSPFPYFYGPLQAAFFLGNVCMGAYIFLSVRRGFLAALFLSLLLFLKLQSVLLTPELIGGTLAIFIVLEVLFFLLTKRNRR